MRERPKNKKIIKPCWNSAEIKKDKKARLSKLKLISKEFKKNSDIEELISKELNKNIKVVKEKNTKYAILIDN